MYLIVSVELMQHSYIQLALYSPHSPSSKHHRRRLLLCVGHIAHVTWFYKIYILMY